MLEGLFRLLFKYRPVVFEQAEFAFAVSRPMFLGIVVVVATAAFALASYGGVSAARGRQRALLIGVRVAIVALLVFCLFRPTLVLKAAVPQQNFLGVLVDDSRSMQIADRGVARSELVRRMLGPGSPVLDALSKKFVLRYFRFSSSAERVDQLQALQFAGGATRLGQALDRARDELSGLPLAGLVMVSDGADTTNAALDQSLASLKARSVPVFTVGVGAERFSRDIQVTRVETPRAELKGTSLVVNVTVTQSGYADAKVPLIVEDDGHIVASQEFTLPRDGESTTVPVKFTAAEPGPRAFRFRVPVQPDEQVTENNARDALVEVRDRREKILYLEGEPRFEAKFVRRAVEDDKNLQVVILQRTAENKFLRLDVESPTELVAGFPTTRDELFAYRGIILGSVEADSFTPEQLRMLADFVGRRGGGLMMLGGRRAFVEGGWAGTPLAEVLPVVVESGSGRPAPYFAELAVHPTRDGAIYPVTQIAATDEASAAKWKTLPPLTAVNPLRSVKPGATVLLAATDARKNEQVVLAYQRYGRGKALAFAVQDSWLWRMHATMGLDDTMHATFWRRLVRWLVDDVPGPVTLTTAEDRVDPGQPVQLTATVGDRAYLDVNDARVVAHVTAPSGKTSEVPLNWTVTKDGEYRGSFVPDENGAYDVRVQAIRADGRDRNDLGTDQIHLRATTGDAEYFDAGMRAPLLRRVAEETGGRFFTAETAGALPDAISYNGRGVTVIEERDLWDMPIVLLLLVVLMTTEWTCRRAWGLA